MDKDSGRSKKKESKKKKKYAKSRLGRGRDVTSRSSRHCSQLRGWSRPTNPHEKNKYKYCKVAHLYAGKHDADKCFYNKKYKGWRLSKNLQGVGCHLQTPT